MHTFTRDPWRIHYNYGFHGDIFIVKKLTEDEWLEHRTNRL